jgi:hypothetical protein
MWFRRPGLRFYAWLFGCNLNEMKDPDLMHYDNLADFFYRELRDDARPIDGTSILVSIYHSTAYIHVCINIIVATSRSVRLMAVYYIMARWWIVKWNRSRVSLIV